MNDGEALFVVPVGPPVIVVSGAVVSTVNDRDAGVASTLPAASVARTRNVYTPSASEPRMRGDVQGPNEPTAAPGPSSRHSNVEPASVEENVNVALLTLIVPVGPPVIVVSGAVVSTVNERVAGRRVGVARGCRSRGPRTCTRRRRAPCSSAARCSGVRAGRRARAVELALERRARLRRGERERRRGVVRQARRARRDRRVRRGRLDRERPRRRRSRRRCRRHRSRGPRTCTSRRPAGRRHAATCSSRRCRSWRPGRRACTRTSRPASVDENVNDGEASFVVPVGPLVIVVSGAAVSTVNVRVAGRRVDVAGGVGRADRERVRAVGERRRGARRRAARVGPRRAPGPSSLHSKVAPGLVGGERERRCGDVRRRPSGPMLIVVSGATVSTVNVRVAGRGVDVARGVHARTENV